MRIKTSKLAFLAVAAIGILSILLGVPNQPALAQAHRTLKLTAGSPLQIEMAPNETIEVLMPVDLVYVMGKPTVPDIVAVAQLEAKDLTEPGAVRPVTQLIRLGFTARANSGKTTYPVVGGTTKKQVLINGRVLFYWVPDFKTRSAIEINISGAPVVGEGVPPARFHTQEKVPGPGPKAGGHQKPPASSVGKEDENRFPLNQLPSAKDKTDDENNRFPLNQLKTGTTANPGRAVIPGQQAGGYIPKTSASSGKTKYGIAFKLLDKDWIPRVGNYCRIMAQIFEQKDGSTKWVPSKVGKIIRFELVESSNEKGVCLNRGEQTTPDLFFADPGCDLSGGTGAYYMVATTKHRENVYTIDVCSDDFGSFGKVQATAGDCVPLVWDHYEMVVEEGESKPVSVPRDKNDNKIADAWEEHEGNFAITADLDYDGIPEGNGKRGDGLSAYEEYRGFFCMGNHERTDWRVKDLFIYDRDSLGFGYFPEKTAINCHRISKSEFKHEGHALLNNRVINFNRGYATNGAQHCIEIRNEANLFGEQGLTNGFGPIGGFGPPKNVDYISIDRSLFGNLRSDIELLNEVITHELGHAVGARHHGGHVLGDGSVDTIYPATMVNQAIPRRKTMPGVSLGPYALPHKFWIGEKQNRMCGAENCFMRYHNPGNICVPAVYPTANGGYELVGAEGLDTINADEFCTTPYGHLFNAKNRCAGTATKGDCRHQFVINDHAD